MIPKAALIDGASRVADDAMEDSAWECHGLVVIDDDRGDMER